MVFCPKQAAGSKRAAMVRAVSDAIAKLSLVCGDLLQILSREPESRVHVKCMSRSGEGHLVSRASARNQRNYQIILRT